MRSSRNWILFFYNIFIATLLPDGICIPDFTLPNVPYPIVLPIRKSPIFLDPLLYYIQDFLNGKENLTILYFC